MVTEISAGKLQEKLGEVLNHLEKRSGSVLIHKDGKPVAALVDAELFARIQRMERRFEELSTRIADAYRSVPAEDGNAEIDAAARKERHS